MSGIKDGYHDFDDFLALPYTTPTTEANYGRYRGFSSTGGVLGDNDEIGGGLILSSDGDDEGASFGDFAFPYQISRSHGKLWFECRVKTSTIDDAKHGILVGLYGRFAITTTRSVLTAIAPIAAAGTIVDSNFVGFHRLEGDGDQFDTVYRADGVTQVTVGANAVTIVADTYVKLGFVFDPRNYVLTFYKNGVKLADSYTVVAAAGTDFPNDVRLGRVMAVLNATASTPGQSEIDWWRVAQLSV